MAPPAPSAGARLLLRRLLSTATEAAAATAAPTAPSAGARLLLRRLHSTATEAAAETTAPTAPAAASAVAAPTAPSADAAKPAKKDPRLLYRRLSALGGRAGEGSVSRVLNKWVREGGAPRSVDLIKHVKELRKYKRHAHALEVFACLHLAYQPGARPFDLC